MAPPTVSWTTLARPGRCGTATRTAITASCAVRCLDPAQWLERPLLLRAAAAWLARRCKARGISQPRRLTITEVRGRQALGVIDHGDYTDATGDGSHWDVGTGFPWDLVWRTRHAFWPGRHLHRHRGHGGRTHDRVRDGCAQPSVVGHGPHGTLVRLARLSAELMKDLGLSKVTSVKLIPPANLARIPLREQLDEQVIVDQVVARIAAMTPAQQKLELMDQVPTEAYVAAAGSGAVQDTARPPLLAPPVRDGAHRAGGAAR